MSDLYIYVLYYVIITFIICKFVEGVQGNKNAMWGNLQYFHNHEHMNKLNHNPPSYPLEIHFWQR